MLIITLKKRVIVYLADKSKNYFYSNFIIKVIFI